MRSTKIHDITCILGSFWRLLPRNTAQENANLALNSKDDTGIAFQGTDNMTTSPKSFSVWDRNEQDTDQLLPRIPLTKKQIPFEMTSTDQLDHFSNYLVSILKISSVSSTSIQQNGAPEQDRCNHIAGSKESVDGHWNVEAKSNLSAKASKKCLTNEPVSEGFCVHGVGSDCPEAWDEEEKEAKKVLGRFLKHSSAQCHNWCLQTRSIC